MATIPCHVILLRFFFYSSTERRAVFSFCWGFVASYDWPPLVRMDRPGAAGWKEVETTSDTGVIFHSFIQVLNSDLSPFTKEKIQDNFNF